MTSEKALGNAGYAIFGSGGGGSGGQYVFASLEELDAIITEWTAIRDDIYNDGERLLQALRLEKPPADDIMSRRQSNALDESLEKAMAHNQHMFEYAESYVKKLAAALEQYVDDDESVATRMGRVDEI